MPVNILMPALSPTMTEGKLAKWHVNEGDEVSSGDVIAEIETDKATMEVEAVDEGVIGKLNVAEGTDNVAVNSVIAVLLEDGEDASDVAQQPENKPVNKAETTKEEPKTEAPKADVKNTFSSASTASSNGDRLRVSPLARRLASQVGLELSSIKGSGPKGRILAADVRDAEKLGVKANAPASVGVSSGPDPKAIADAFGLAHEVIPANKMRQTIARRLTESKQTVPHFYLTVDINMDKLMAARKEINAGLEASGGGKVSVNDFIIKASALSLNKVKAANASWNGDSVVQYENAHVSVAVAIEGGLITPVIRLAETKSLTELSSEMKDLAGRAREGKLAPSEFQGGTFSISNLGMMGVKEFSAVINPPESMILAVGAGEKRPVVLPSGELGISMVMSVTLSCDHRVVDGALGAEWLQSFKTYMENPLSMLV
ncbi:MAG: pyruvate dehydrogenase complex dihydrolipoamide acetyltransferase [Alphaproteobacteria bacterium]